MPRLLAAARVRLAAVVVLAALVARGRAQCESADCAGQDCDGWENYMCSELEEFGCECAGCTCANDPVPDGNVCNDGEKPAAESYLGDGYCDADEPTLNSANCNWDFGDCCEETCANTTSFTCGASYPFHCLDPEQDSYYTCQATCFAQTCDFYASYDLSCWAMEGEYGCSCSNCECVVASTTESVTTVVTTAAPECPASHVGDGLCDTHARGNKGCNTADFDYDGGDCCPSSCSADECGSTYAYDCQDPGSNSAICNVGAYEAWLGDGFCDSYGGFNTKACDWDGGDCCADTCVDGEAVERTYLSDDQGQHICGEDSAYDCLDPDSNSSHCNVGFDSWLGDGKCDTTGYYNTLACGWDGGDCCASTCVDRDNTTLTGCTRGGELDCDFYVAQSNATFNMTCRVLEQHYDFDCTGCALCAPACEEYGKVCKDPAADDFRTCQHNGQGAGDGVCDDGGGYNTALCGWDGGDCCDDTCVNPDPDTFGGCFDTSFYNCDYYIVQYGYTCAELSAAGLNCGGCTQCLTPCSSDADNKVCRDPESANVTDACQAAFPEFVGDNYCDRLGTYNTFACNWDGGDCCLLSCLANSLDLEGVQLEHDCNATQYACRDPQFACVGEWTQWGNCDASCGGGVKLRKFAVSQNATGGATACDFDRNEVQERSCGTEVCDEDQDGIHDSLDSCPADAENDADGDGKCGDNDPCPYDAQDDFDDDNVCADKDACPLDDANDFDSDEICGNVDSCPVDPDNDADSDATCLPDDACPTSPDDDSDYVCFEADSCPLDAGNDIDSDALCGDVDPCPTDPTNDADSDGTCDGRDSCIAVASKLGDGVCDAADNFNTKDCGWDGGDCCRHTCGWLATGANSTSAEGACATEEFECLDPLYAACTYEFPQRIGDGRCDAQRRANSAACNWDGGDCCASTCVSAYHGCGATDYACQDPDADDAVCNVYYVTRLGDGRCDGEAGQYNTAACGFDGGDCCATTCNSSAAYPCGHWTHYDCLDENAPNSSEACAVAHQSRLGDGLCDAVGAYNTLACGWDAGDCCPDTCAPNATAPARSGCLYTDCDAMILDDPNAYTCATLQAQYGFDCRGCALCNACDDAYSCRDPGSNFTGVEQCVGEAEAMGDGKCDAESNTHACGWDGGDCCGDTCAAALCAFYDGLYGHVCRDPNSTEFNACTAEWPEYVGDGLCDSEGGYNTLACNWDGGDCCELSCLTEGLDFDYACGEIENYDCVDPTYACAGAWTQWSVCGASCGTGSHHRTFLITRNATGGGAVCETEHAQVFVAACNTQVCDADGDGVADDDDSCPADAENDADGDNSCSTDDDCPYDAANDSDDDSTCDSDDACPADPANDFDSDEVCGDVDSCPQDPENDPDGNGVCNVGRPCGVDPANDADSDEICAAADLCPLDAGNDIDSDQLCAADDPCPLDPLNDGDSDGVCDSKDACLALPAKLGDGTCDAGDETFGVNNTYNSHACDWDGGDCCAHTCLTTAAANSSASSVYYSEPTLQPCDWVVASPVYQCADPLYQECAADAASFVGDGYCDDHKRTNTLACNWDGGDCCASTCDGNAFYRCGFYDYDCQDPDGNNDECTAPESYLGDGYCDGASGQFDTLACNWDGGDVRWVPAAACVCNMCCASTCLSSAAFGCGHYTVFTCADPDANNTQCNVEFPSYVGDGVCDLVGHYNTQACDWDGGDCCPDTCGTSCSADDPGLVCKNPNSTAFSLVTCGGAESWIGDGYCDSGTGENTAACGWDAGDCCEDTCDCGDACFKECGEDAPYVCLDPNSTSFDSCGVDYPEYLGDAMCDVDASYNTEKCGWDGGDCCARSCLLRQQDSGSGGNPYNYECGLLGYECADPKYANTVSADGSTNAVVGTGLRNVVSADCPYCTIAGGAANTAFRATGATVVGGLRNAAFSNHASVVGGFENLAVGRFSTVVGGSRNTVSARHSVALGFQARVAAQVSFVAAFVANVGDASTDQDAQCVLGADDDRAVRLCADDVFFNDVDVLALVSRARRLAAREDREAALRRGWTDLAQRMAATRARVGARLAEQELVLREQQQQAEALRRA